MKYTVGHSRKGFALMAVVVIAAVLVVSGAMLTTQLLTEGHVTKTDAIFKSALNVAEEGLNTTLSSLRTQSVPPGGTTAWLALLEGQANVVRNGQVPTPVIVVGTVERDGVRGGYRSEVTVVASPAPGLVSDTETETDAAGTLTTTTDKWTLHVRVASVGAVYPQAVASMLSGGTQLADGFSARRAVRTNSVVQFTVTRRTGTTAGTFIPATTYNVDMAIFTGGDLSIRGSSQEFDGDVLAKYDVYVHKSDGIVNGVAYAGGTVSGQVPPGSLGGVTVPPLPDIVGSLPGYILMNEAYLNGTLPYDGSDTANYTDTRHYLDDGVTVNPNYIKYHIAELTVAPDNYRYFTDPTAVYYVDHDLHIASSANLAGTVVVDGNVFISGSVDVVAGAASVAILATGDVTKDTGCSYIEGVIVAGGTFTGRGNADVYGAIICGGSVDLSGNYNIRYDKSLTGFPNGDGKFIPGGTYSGTPGYVLDDLALPDPGDRIWQEFTPAS